MNPGVTSAFDTLCRMDRPSALSRNRPLAASSPFDCPPARLSALAGHRFVPVPFSLALPSRTKSASRRARYSASRARSAAAQSSSISARALARLAKDSSIAPRRLPVVKWP